MKTKNIGGSSTSHKHDKVSPWTCIGGSTPPQSRVPLLPKYMNKPLLWRIKEWFK